jgi:hypothetical protein
MFGLVAVSRHVARFSRGRDIVLGERLRSHAQTGSNSALMSRLWGCPWGYPQGGRSHRGKGLSECFPSNGCDDLTGLEFGPSHGDVPARGGGAVCVVVRAGFAVAGCETGFSANVASSAA